MKKEIKNLILGWANANNGHPCDNDRFYEIVMKSENNKLSELQFIETLQNKYDEENEREPEGQETNEMDSEGIVKYYQRYEDLWCFLKYLRKQEQ